MLIYEVNQSGEDFRLLSFRARTKTTEMIFDVNQNLADLEENPQLAVVKKKIAAFKRKDHDTANPLKSIRRDRASCQFLIYSDRVWMGEFRSKGAAQFMHHLLYVFRDRPQALLCRRGMMWLAKPAVEWAVSLQMSEGAVSRMIRQLEKLGYIDRIVAKVANTPISHIKPNWPKVAAVYARAAGEDHTEFQLTQTSTGKALIDWLVMGIGPDAVHALVSEAGGMYDEMAKSGTPPVSELDIFAAMIKECCTVTDLPDSVLNTRQHPLPVELTKRLESATNAVIKQRTKLYFSRNSEVNKLSRSRNRTNCPDLYIQETKTNGRRGTVGALRTASASRPPYKAYTPDPSSLGKAAKGVLTSSRDRNPPKKRPPLRLRLRDGGLFSSLISGKAEEIVQALRPDIPVELSKAYRVRVLPGVICDLRAKMKERVPCLDDYSIDEYVKGFLAANTKENINCTQSWFNPITQSWVNNLKPCRITFPCDKPVTTQILRDNQRWVYRYTPALNSLVLEEDRVETAIQALADILEAEESPMNPLRVFQVKPPLKGRVDYMTNRKTLKIRNNYDDYFKPVDHLLCNSIEIARKDEEVCL